VGREAWSARNIRPLSHAWGHPMLSAENWIELIGGIVLVIYLFVALTHPEWF
jgi:K+-transporting ATPase KdpF subunit